MAVTKSEPDGQHPASHYLVVEDPTKTTTWHLRVRDASGKLNHTLMGAAYAALTVGYRGNKYEGPNKAKALAKLRALYRSEKMPWPGDSAKHAHAGTFAVDELVADTGSSVIRTGVLFKAGDYPEQGMTITADELATAADRFTGVENEIEHTFSEHGRRTILDGETGQVIAVWADGDTLYGDVEVPKWLDPIWEQYGCKVSTVWDIPTKTILRNGLVIDPVVPEAALMSSRAAFFAARHDTPEGQMAMQSIHDLAAQRGAVCTPGNTAKMASSHEAKALQSIHDLTTANGAMCSSGSKPAWYSRSDRGGKKRMNIRSWLGLKPEVQQELISSGVPAPDPADVAAFSQQVDEEVNRRVADERALFASKLQAEATTRLINEAKFSAEALIHANKLLPVAREVYEQGYVRMGLADMAMFARGETTTPGLLDMYKAPFEAAPAHNLTQQTLDPSRQFSAMFNNTNGDGSNDIADKTYKATMEALKKEQNGGRK